MSNLTITAISIRTGMATSTIRTLERRGIVQPGRDSSGRRLYNEEDITKILEYLKSKKLHSK